MRTVELNLNGELDLENVDDEKEEDEDPNDRCEAWQWAAYSLFSRYAAHKIKRLEMDLHNLQRIEVDAVRQVLGSSTPLALLLDPYGEATDGSTMSPSEVQPSRFRVMDPAERSHNDTSQCNANYTVTTNRPITVRVLEPPTNDENRWWSVFLPGKGMMWLHRDDVLSTIQSNPNGDDYGHGKASIVPSVRRIDTARFSDDSRDGVADLIEHIGAGSRRVDLHNPSGRQPIDDWCAHNLRNPSFAELASRVCQFLVDAADAGQSKLQAFTVLCVLTTEPQYVRRFFETLRDPRHALTRHLQDLELWLFIEKHDVTDIIGPALQMLEQNRQLHTIRLGFHVAPAVASLEAVFRQAFAAQLETALPIQLAPLEIQSKLALLSVLFAETTTVASSAVHRLYSSLLSVVFQFAAQSRTRIFTLSFHR